MAMRLSQESALLTDLYQFTMLQAYFSRGMNDTAVFELFVRALPDDRNFLMAAGLEQVVDFLENLGFDEEALSWLRSSGMFNELFLESLKDFRFTGDVDAMPEGTVFFGDEPILRITAPLREAQFIESRVINLMHFQTVVASKAVRSVIAASGKQLIDFGLRRAHGAEAAILSARASYIAGFDGTATTIAAPLFGIPVFGTMAHSFIQAHDNEMDAFTDFARDFPESTTLLIDTYDTEAAAEQVVHLAHWLKKNESIRINAVRIDSGDLGEVARRVRRIFDAGGCEDIRIFASGNLDEYELHRILQGGAPIDGFGIGTRMNTSSDAPYLDCAYKLQEYAGEPRRKRSLGKQTWPGRKQVFRSFGKGGTMCGDILALEGDDVQGKPLLQPVMRGGKRAGRLPSLPAIREYASYQVETLPAVLTALGKTPAYIVRVSDSLRHLAQQADERQRDRKQVRARCFDVGKSG